MTLTVSPSITVIVCTRDRPELIQQCLSALSRQTYPRFEVLVVDNAPTRPVENICERWGASWILAPSPGLTCARNIGARLAHGEIVAFIDDDAVVEVGWLDALVDDFRDSEVAAVTGRVRYMKAQGESRAMSGVEAADQVVRARRSFDQSTSGWFALACFGGIGDGGNMAFRRKLIASEHSFDERLGRGRLLASGDEAVIFAALIGCGYRVTHNPDAIVRHPSPATPELQRVRRFSDLRLSIAHLFFVWYEFPAHHIDILRFLSQAVHKRIFAKRHPSRLAANLPRWQALRAMFSGVLLYWRASREWPMEGRPEDY